MIKQIDKNELLDLFFDLVAEVEFGNHFEKSNPEYIKLLKDTVNKHIGNGAEIFGYYEDEGNKPIGFVTTVVGKRLRTMTECEVLEIGVVRELRSRGYGSKLLEFVEKYYDKKNIYCILVRTYAADFEAIHFYGKNGYAPISVIPDTQGPGDEGTIVMRKRLPISKK